MRLSDEALVLERRHVVADGGRGDAEVVPLDQRLRPDGLLGADVVLDDRAKHLELPVVEHVSLPSEVAPPCAVSPILALGGRECQWYSYRPAPPVSRCG